ncbi:hypothetical protein ABFS83_11G105000 [Erythranthe nasuta]
MLRRREALASNTPCAACKCLRRKCVNDCIFAPYFPPNDPQKFTNVHKVFGASNVSKILHELHPQTREDAVKSLVFEAECRLQDKVYGCVKHIYFLQETMKKLLNEIQSGKMNLSSYMGPQAMLVGTPHDPHRIEMQQIVAREQQQQQQQLMLHHQLQQQLMLNDAVSFNDVFDGPGNGNSVTASGLNQMPAASVMSSGLNQMPAAAVDVVHPNTVGLDCSYGSHPQMMQPQMESQLQQQEQILDSD